MNSYILQKYFILRNKIGYEFTRKTVHKYKRKTPEKLSIDEKLLERHRPHKEK